MDWKYTSEAENKDQQQQFYISMKGVLTSQHKINGKPCESVKSFTLFE